MPKELDILPYFLSQAVGYASHPPVERRFSPSKAYDYPWPRVLVFPEPSGILLNDCIGMNKRPPASDATLSVHAGEDRHGRNAPLTTEIQQTAVFALKNTEQLRRYAAGDPEVFLYTRYGNPTLRAAEEKSPPWSKARNASLPPAVWPLNSPSL